MTPDEERDQVWTDDDLDDHFPLEEADLEPAQELGARPAT